MRSKNILSVVAFIAAFAFSAAFASLFIDKNEYQLNVNFDRKPVTACFRHRGDNTADKITAFINQDKRNGSESDRILYLLNNGIYLPSDGLTFTGYAKSVEQYADASGSMKASDFPKDFQIAWSEHMKAWRDYSEFLNRMKNISARKSLNAEEFDEIDKFHGREINRTYQEVLQTGAIYGAKID